MNIELLCNNTKNPLGICGTPTFGWRCIANSGEGKKQISYRVSVCEESGKTLWDSGTVESSVSNFIRYGGNELKPFSKYTWKISVGTEVGVFESETAYFVTGLKDTDWSAEWISTETVENAPILYKKFELEENDKEIYAFICGLGYFELHINGQKVGDDYFVPNWTDYDTVSYSDLKYDFNGVTKKRLNYLVYEVSKYLKEGENTVEIWLGNGFFKQELRKTEGSFNYGQLKAIFQMIGDGWKVLTDHTWKARKSPIILNNIYYGEVYDNRVSENEELTVSVVEKPDAIFQPQFAPTDRISEIKELETEINGIYDSKEVMSGFVGFKCSGERGAKVEIYYSENIDSNCELDFSSTVGYEDCDRNQIQKDIYILSGEGTEEYIPKFVWHGFRYFKIVCKSAEVFDVRAFYVHSNIEKTGHFICSDEGLNKLHNMYHNSLKSNLHGGVPSDCPHRERLGYTGDGQVASDSAMYNYDMYAFYKKWVYDILDAQNQETGFVPHTAPFAGGGGGPAWGCAIVVVPWNLYRHYGDVESLSMTVEAMKKWLLYLKEKKNNDGVIYREENGSWCLGEWCLPADFSWCEPRFDEIKIPSELVNTSYYVYCLKIYKKVLAILGLNDEMVDVEIENATEAINREFLDEYYSEGVQGCDLFPLSAGVVPEDKKKDIINHIKKCFAENDYCMDTGLLGTKFLFEILNEYELNNIAYKLLKQKKYPSYGYMLEKGATSVWETWEGTGSMSHEALISFDSWFYYGLCGISIDYFERFDKVVIKPYYPDDLDFVKTKMSIPCGELKLEWVRKGSSIRLTVEIPFNAEASVQISNGEMVELGAGRHKFIINTKMRR